MEMNRASLGEIIVSIPISRSEAQSISTLFQSYFYLVHGTWYFVRYFIFVTNSTFLVSFRRFLQFESPRNTIPQAFLCRYKFRPNECPGFQCRTDVIRLYHTPRCVHLRRSATLELPMHRLLHPHLDCKHSLWSRN